MLQIFAIGMRATHLQALRRKGLRDCALYLGLGGPTDLVSRLTQIAAGDENHFACRCCDGSLYLRYGIC